MTLSQRLNLFYVKREEEAVACQEGTKKSIDTLKDSEARTILGGLFLPAYFAIDFRPKCEHIVDQGCVFPW